jgi:hypothetical protein
MREPEPTRPCTRPCSEPVMFDDVNGSNSWKVSQGFSQEIGQESLPRYLAKPRALSSDIYAWPNDEKSSESDTDLPKLRSVAPRHWKSLLLREDSSLIRPSRGSCRFQNLECLSATVAGCEMMFGPACRVEPSKRWKCLLVRRMRSYPVRCGSDCSLSSSV